MDELSLDQDKRKETDPEAYQKLEKFIDTLREFVKGEKFPATIKLRDPSGNSNIKNPYMPKLDKNIQITNFPRSIEELLQMGYSQENANEMYRVDDAKIVGNKINFSEPFEEEKFLQQEAI